MKLKKISRVSLIVMSLCATNAFAANYWSDDKGGDFNMPPVTFNPTFHGYTSTGNTTYNKIDLQNGDTMEISDADLYDNQGNIIGTVIESGIGWHDSDGDGEKDRDGGIVAGAITRLEINGKKKTVVYAWSVNIEEGGRKSGWVKLSKLSPKQDIKSILKENKKVRLALIEDSLNDADYVRKTIKEATLPSEAAEWYLMAGRTGGAGKAKYYFTREGLITGLMNIPETGSQRYGVGHTTAPIGSTFYRDKNVDIESVDIYPPDSSSKSDYTLDLAWGYFVNSAGKKWYSWVNAETLD